MTPDSSIHFVIWLLIAASVIAVIASRLRIPYTVALVIGGLVLGLLNRLPSLESLAKGQRPDWLTPQVVLVLFLPPLLFEGSIKIQFQHLRKNLVPILLLANLGVLAATLITGLAMHWAFGLPLMITLLFGAVISATDPISVLSVFEEMGVGKRLSMIVEGESLFNDGTAVVLFGILLAGATTGNLHIATGLEEFVVVVLGGATLGAFLGFLASKITQRLDDPRIELTLTTILAYVSYLAALSLHLSGVIATVAAGIVFGNVGVPVGMSRSAQISLWAFWDYAAFVINSILFLLIGMQVRLGDLARGWHAVLLAIGAVLLGRILSVYTLVPLSNLFSERLPLRCQHVLVWGGLRGALALALVLSLEPAFPHRSELLNWTFGVVAFSLIVQGLTIKPLLRALGIGGVKQGCYESATSRRIQSLLERSEFDEAEESVELPDSAQFGVWRDLDATLAQAETQTAEMSPIDAGQAAGEIRSARHRLAGAEKRCIERAVRDGRISQKSAAEILNAADRNLSELAAKESELAESVPENGPEDNNGTTTMRK